MTEQVQGVRMSLREVIDYFNKGIEDAENLVFPTRSSSLQEEMCRRLDVLQSNATSAKRQCARDQEEDLANLFLGFECALGAVKSELMMWLFLKRDRPAQAWERLVAAQMACLDASRAHKNFAHLDQVRHRFEEMERLIFPPQVFMSAGFVAKSLECSICRQRYGKCGHLRGKPYMGEFCEVIHREIEADHVAVVEVPADKRCRVVSVKIKEGHRDKLSWEVKPYKEGESFSDDGPLEITTVFLNADRYPYLDRAEKMLAALPESAGDEVGVPSHSTSSDSTPI